ncbi:MAG TPA: hypothetical protein VGJ98_07460 [Candidatus Eisenbacteria bacterium]|jgi:hypothetical protein
MILRVQDSRRVGCYFLVAAFVVAGTITGASRVSAAPSNPDSMTLRAGQPGTEFRSMTVEGEDRVHVDFGRPELNLDLDPEDVPGLTRGTAMDVLDRTVPELATPLVAMSSQERSPFVARPWLRQFATGAVARFRPAVKGVVRWKMLVADSRGETVASFEGKGDPPKEITWDGRTKSGMPVTPGLTYSYVFEAHDRAGNKRNFVGQGFTVSAYRFDSPNGQVLVMSGRDLAPAEMSGYGPNMRAGSKDVPPIFLEVASWLNQSPKVREPIRVAVGARTLDQASMLANRALSALSSRVLGDPARVQAITQIAPDAPEDGVLRIGNAK